MKLHSDKLSETTIRKALDAARSKGHVTGGIECYKLERQGSNSRANGFEIRLGSTYADGIHKRKNMDSSGNYAATWSEWGWFIRELFMLDNDLTFGRYKSLEDFHEVTRYAFV